MKRKTCFFILGLLILNIVSLAPSPILSVLKSAYGIQSDAVANFMVSITYPVIMVTSLLGGKLLQKISEETVFLIALLLSALGCCANYAAQSIHVFFAGRIVFSIGMGLTYPLFGAAIVRWYGVKNKKLMASLESMLPFAGSLLSYALVAPLYNLFGSWKSALGLWGVFAAILAAVWVFSGCQDPQVRDRDAVPSSVLNENSRTEPMGKLYRRVFGIKDIRYLLFIYFCDFFVCTYIMVILPTALSAMSSVITPNLAGVISAFLYPGFGMAGSFLGGVLIRRGGDSYRFVTLAQAVKVIGVLLCCIPTLWCAALGFALFGFGNSFWMPSFYMIPTERLKHDALGLGNTFGLMTAAGMAAGSVAPSIGGWLTDMFYTGAWSFGGGYVDALRLSLGIFTIMNVMALVLAGTMERNRRREKNSEGREENSLWQRDAG